MTWTTYKHHNGRKRKMATLKLILRRTGQRIVLRVKSRVAQTFTW